MGEEILMFGSSDNEKKKFCRHKTSISLTRFILVKKTITLHKN